MNRAAYRVLCKRLADYYETLANSSARAAQNLSPARRMQANITVQKWRDLGSAYRAAILKERDENPQ